MLINEHLEPKNFPFFFKILEKPIKIYDTRFLIIILLYCILSEKKNEHYYALIYTFNIDE